MNIRTMPACFLMLLPAICAHAQPATGSRQVIDRDQTPMEEITVIGQRSIMNLRLQLDRAVDRMYAIYNEINKDDEFDIICRWEAPTGSRIDRKLCTPVFVDTIQATATQYALWDINYSSTPDNSSTSLYVDYSAIAVANQKLREHMKRLILGNPRLFDAVVEEARLRQELKRQRRAYWGLKE